MNNYCRHLSNIDEWILKNKNYFSELQLKNNEGISQWLIPQEALSEKFITWYESLGLDIWYRELFYTPPNGNIFLHSDEIYPNKCCKLNWVYDQGNTTMEWYEPKEGVELEWQENKFVGGSYYSCLDEECDFVHSDIVKTPSLVNVSALHLVKNNSNFPRWCVSIAFIEKNAEKRLQWDRALEIFKDHL